MYLLARDLDEKFYGRENCWIKVNWRKKKERQEFLLKECTWEINKYEKRVKTVKILGLNKEIEHLEKEEMENHEQNRSGKINWDSVYNKIAKKI